MGLRCAEKARTCTADEPASIHVRSPLCAIASCSSEPAAIAATSRVSQAVGAPVALAALAIERHSLST